MSFTAVTVQILQLLSEIEEPEKIIASLSFSIISVLCNPDRSSSIG